MPVELKEYVLIFFSEIAIYHNSSQSTYIYIYVYSGTNSQTLTY